MSNYRVFKNLEAYKIFEAQNDSFSESTATNGQIQSKRKLEILNIFLEELIHICNYYKSDEVEVKEIDGNKISVPILKFK